MRTPLIALVLATAVTSHRAAAADFCVGTGAELQQALSTAGSSPEADSIRLRTGVYQRAMPGTPGAATMFRLFTVQNGAIFITGGWNAACTASTLDPIATVLYGEGVHPVLEIVTSQSSTANIVLSNLAIAGGYSDSDQRAALASIRANSTGPSTIDVAHVDFSGGEALDAQVVGLQAPHGRISFWNNVVHFNEAAGGNVVNAIATADGVVELTNNTVTQNTSPQWSAVFLQGQGSFKLFNNVIWGNTGLMNFAHSNVDLDAGGNHLGPSVVLPASTGTTTGDPMFANALQSDYRPLMPSPLRNSGVADPPGGRPALDFAGVARSAGGRIDRGAYEYEELMANGFE